VGNTFNDYVYYSTNAGASWAHFAVSGSSVQGVCADGSTIVAATNGGVSVSTNGGASWSTSTTANGLGSNGVVGVTISGSTIYAATAGGVSISTNEGASWSNFTTANGLVSNSVSSVCISGSTIYATNGSSLSISTDGGSSWSTALTIPSGYALTGVSVEGSTICVSTWAAGVWISRDEGSTWNNNTIAQGLASNDVSAVFVQ